VVLDVRVGAHGGVQGDGVAGLVGVVAPVAELGGGQQGLLGAGVQGLAAHDQPGAFGPVGQVDQVGELGHLGAVADLAVLAASRRPSGRVGLGVGPRDRRGDIPGGAGDHGEADVAVPAAPDEPVGAAGRVGAHHPWPGHQLGGVAGPVPGGHLDFVEVDSFGHGFLVNY
jgi:hypothetical protein